MATPRTSPGRRFLKTARQDGTITTTPHASLRSWLGSRGFPSKSVLRPAAVYEAAVSSPGKPRQDPVVAHIAIALLSS